MIVPTLCVGMQPRTPRVPAAGDAERRSAHSHAERGNDQRSAGTIITIGRTTYLSPRLRSIANPAQVWLTGISSRLLTLTWAGVFMIQKMVSAMS